MTITLKSRLLQETVDLRDNSFPTVAEARDETDRSFKELLRARRKL